MNRRLEIGTEVYLVLSPNNYIKKYRFVKCKVKSIYYRRSTQRNMVEYDDTNIPKDYKVTLSNIDNERTYYCNKHLDKIYFEDKLNQLNIDIENLNKILEFKLKQKEELQNFILNEFPNWKYRGNQ